MARGFWEDVEETLAGGVAGDPVVPVGVNDPKESLVLVDAVSRAE